MLMIIVPFGTMNRRNFILGLGTAATLSGAASVTGAALNDTVTPDADFRVIAAEELNLQKNEFINDAGDSNYTDASFSEFTHTDTDSPSAAPNMTVSDDTDGDIQMALATFNDADQDYNNNGTSSDLPYVNDTVGRGPAEGGEAPLQVTNNTGTTQEVGVSYNYGSDVGTDISQSQVNELFTFHMEDNSGSYTQISPAGNSGTNSSNTASITAGETTLVNLEISMTQSIEDSITANASSTNDATFNDPAVDDVDLLDTVEFGTNNT
jgi:hypothetical protein